MTGTPLNDRWEKAEIVRKRKEPHSYDIRTAKGIVRRARHHIRDFNSEKKCWIKRPPEQYTP